jgi:hypothetical protein
VRTDTTATGLFVGKPSQILPKGIQPLTAADALNRQGDYRRLSPEVNNKNDSNPEKTSKKQGENGVCRRMQYQFAMLLPRRFGRVSAPPAAVTKLKPNTPGWLRVPPTLRVFLFAG